jgi:hypothetical protein
MIKKSSSLMTIGGIMAAFGTGLIGVPQIVLQTYAIVVKEGPPHWFTVMILPMLLGGILLTTLGTAILGVAGKGADDHSTPEQVQAAAAQAKTAQTVLDADAAAKPEVPTKVIVEPLKEN